MSLPPSTMHQPQHNQVQKQLPPSQQPPPPTLQGPAPPGLFMNNSFGSASTPPGNVNLQLQQAAPLTSSSFPTPRQGGEKRGRNRRLSLDSNTCNFNSSSIHSAPPMMPQPPDHDSNTTDTHESSSKKRRPAHYVAPRTVPATFTSVTTTASGLRRNLSFSRIDPYVSYAQTPSLMIHNHNNTSSTSSSGDGMDMDASTGNQSTAGDPGRVRSMSF